MGLFFSSLANYSLPSVMSFTGTVVKGVGTMHGGITSFVAKVGYHGIVATLSSLFF
tara:strand:+ start:3169 stop:3336 length:168 start_codon:yes stop_codon:yes gene_type:complete